MSTDALKATFWNQLRQRDLRAFRGWLQPELFAKAAQQAGVPLGQGPLHLGNLVWLALASAWQRTKSFAEVLVLVLKLLQDAAEWPTSELAAWQRRGQQQARRQRRRKHDPRGQDPARVSEEAFVQARRKMPAGFWTALILLLTQQFEEAHAPRLRWKQFRLLALDGTGLALPQWRKLAEAFGTTGNGRGRRKPQARLVMLQLPLVRMPWRYELTPWTEDERHVGARLLQGLRADDLVLMDRGFWSYGLFWQIQQQGAFFATRLKARVQWRTVRRLGPDDCWVRHQPKDWRKQWRRQGLPEAIDLRVIRYQLRGFRPSAVVTNVLDPQVVSREDWVRLATDAAGQVLEPGLYHRRWEIETTFRELKVTQGLKGHLRSRTPEGIRYEVAGHVLLYLLVRWLMVEAAVEHQADPLRLSFKQALEELADMRQTLLQASPAQVRRVLLPRLLQRIAQHQVLLRPGRHFPRLRDTQPKYKGNGRYQLPSQTSGIAA